MGRRPGSRNVATRWIADDFGTLRFYRHCSRCGGWYEQRIGNFSPRQRDPKTRKVLRWDAWCRGCRRQLTRMRRDGMTPEEVLALSQRRWAAVKADADALAYRRVQNAETARRARANNPESAREAHKRWYAKLKADSERYAAYLENRRIQHRLRQERLGRPVTRSVKTAMGAYKLSAGTTDRRLDVEPLGTWVDVVLAQEVPDRGRGRGGSGSSRDDRSRTMEDLSAELGIEDRVLYRIEHRVFGTVTLGVADRMLTRFDRPVFLDGRRIEQALEQRCREMPGNGERILRYIDLAERIAHLDGAVVERVEDLWPELESAG